jgi:hypothetical protein
MQLPRPRNPRMTCRSRTRRHPSRIVTLALRELTTALLLAGIELRVAHVEPSSVSTITCETISRALLVVGRHDIPGRLRRLVAPRHRSYVHVRGPEIALVNVAHVEFPAFFRVVEPGEQALALLVLRQAERT